MSINETDSKFEKFLTGVTTGFTGLHFDDDQYPKIVQIQKEAKPGDMVEFHLDPTTHYALYIGEGKVISIDVEDSQSIDCAYIRQHTLAEVCGDGKVRVQNQDNIAKLEFNLTARNSQDICQVARTFENRVVSFEPDFRNSEYYCTLWRYGKGFSTQVAKLASNSKWPKSNWWTLSHTNAYFVHDGYAKYKMHSYRHSAFENNNQL